VLLIGGGRATPRAALGPSPSGSLRGSRLRAGSVSSVGSITAAAAAYAVATPQLNTQNSVKLLDLLGTTSISAADGGPIGSGGGGVGSGVSAGVGVVGGGSHTRVNAALAQLGAQTRVKDEDMLREEVRQVKRALVLAGQDNTALRGLIVRLEATIKQKDKNIADILGMQQDTIAGGPDSANGQLIGALRQEKALVSTLITRVRDLQSDVEARDRELSDIRATTKYSQWTELQKQRLKYFEECRVLRRVVVRLRHALDAQHPHAQEADLQAAHKANRALRAQIDAVSKQLTTVQTQLEAERDNAITVRAEARRVKSDAEAAVAAAKKKETAAVDKLKQIKAQNEALRVCVRVLCARAMPGLSRSHAHCIGTLLTLSHGCLRQLSVCVCVCACRGTRLPTLRRSSPVRTG
jgi:hypothetical protein